MPDIWIGPHYARTKLLLLGESQYSWLENGETRHPSERHACDLVEWTTADFPSANRFMKMLSRALTMRSVPTQDELQNAWSRVAFTNYVGNSVGHGPRVRPAPQMWQGAKLTFRAEVLERLQPSRIIVLGKELFKKMPEAQIHISKDVQGYRKADGGVAMCWVLNHPSRGLSWQRLAAVTHFACADALETPDADTQYDKWFCNHEAVEEES